jgi:hypothetical protein
MWPFVLAAAGLGALIGELPVDPAGSAVSDMDRARNLRNAMKPFIIRWF